ncbi:MAG: Spy/CpxP family protein refolding chaperone [Gemmatimonadota bacterium]
MTSMTGRQRFETAGLLVAVFVAGGLGGAALERRSHESNRWTGGARELMSPRGGIPGFYETLGLSEEQRARIHGILEAARPESDSILREALPRLREITVETRSAIADVLTDEQRARLEEDLRSRRERHRGDSSGRGGRGRHDGDDGSS